MSEEIVLGDVASVFNGKTPAKKDQRDSGHPVLKIRDVTDEGEFCGSFKSFVEREFAEKHAKKRVHVGDVLVLNAAHNAEYVGSKQFRATQDVGGSIATGEWLIARSRDPRLAQGYLWHWFRSPITRFEIKRRVRGIHLYPRDVAELRIPLPPVNEQRRIAAILDKADTIRRKRRQALALADEVLKSAYVYLVGYKHPDHVRWCSQRIEQLAEERKGSMRTGPFGSALRHSEFVDEGVAVLGIDNAVDNRFAWGERRYITEDKYSDLTRYRVFPGDVIITIMGTTGRSAVVPDDIPEAITTKHLATITCNREKILPELLSFAVHSDPLLIRQIRQANKGAVMNGLNLGIIRKLEINVPPLAAQQAFVRFLRKIEQSREKGSTGIGSGEDLFMALSQRAFRSEL